MSSGDPETRNRILTATWRLMEKQKGRDVRVEDIAREAKVSRQAVYLHFKTRAELLVATVRHVDETLGLKDRLQPLYTASGGAELLDAYIEFWGNYLPEIYGLARALLAVRETDDAADAAWEDRMAALRDGGRPIIDCLIREDLLAAEWDAGRATDALWALLSVDVWESLIVDRGWTNEKYVETMKIVVRRTFLKAR